MKKVVIAIDYAPVAQKVAELGYDLAKSIKAEIILVHIIEDVVYYSSTVYDPIMGFGGFTNPAFLGSDAQKIIEKEAYIFLEKIRMYLNDKDIKNLVAHGKIADSILQIAKKEKCDLIVIGTHGRTTLEELLLGSTAHKLIKYSTIPIYIIPTKNQP